MKPRPWMVLVLALVGIGLMVWAIPRIGGWLTRPTVTRPEIVGPVDTIPDSTAMQQRPETTQTVVRRLVKPQRKGHVTVSQGTPDTANARRFADAVAEAKAYKDTLKAMRARHDTGSPPPKPKAVLPTTWGKYDGKILHLGITRSDGSVLADTVKAHGHLEWYTGFDKGSDTLPVIRSDAWFVRAAREVKKCTPKAAVAGGGGGALTDTDKPLRGAIRGAVFTLLGCLVG